MEQKENQIRMRVMNMPERISDMYTHWNAAKKKQTRQGRKKYTPMKKIKSQLMYRNEEHLLATHKHLQLACILLFIAFRLCVFLNLNWIGFTRRYPVFHLISFSNFTDDRDSFFV